MLIQWKQKWAELTTLLLKRFIDLLWSIIMITIRGPIEKSPKVKKESRKLVREYLDFMINCRKEEEMEIGEYIRLHGSKEYNDWFIADQERIKELKKHGIIVN